MLVKEMQKEINVSVLRSNSFYSKLTRKMIILWFRPIRIKKENIKSTYKNKTLLNNPRKYSYIPTIEDKFFGEEAIKLGFNVFFEKLKQKYSVTNNQTKTVAVHIRRGNLTASNALYKLFFVSDKWYLQKLKLFSKSEYTFICFTDSIDKNDLRNFSEYNFIVYGKELDPLEAIIRLSTFKYLVLSKSTFSFWAAALSEAKIIISPFENDSDHAHRPFNLKDVY
jgi:hypothetical protein